MTKAIMLMCAGCGSRAGFGLNKVLVDIYGKPLFAYSLDKFITIGFDEYYLICSETDYDYFSEYLKQYDEDIKIIIGGSSRKESVVNGIKNIKSDYVLIHDAARPLITLDDINNILNATREYKCGGLYQPCRNTLRRMDDYFVVDRSMIAEMSTPQFFNKSLFETIINNNVEITDELSLFQNEKMGLVKESHINLKLTYAEDLDIIKKLLIPSLSYIGHSLDYHPFSNEGNLILGGVKFSDYSKLIAHSDGDVLYHAVTEALLGAASLGDLGTLYPDTSNEFLNINSSYLLKDTVNRLFELGYKIQNIDVMVYLIKPNLKEYKLQMAENIKKITGCNQVTIKAATLNKRGLISKEEGIGAEATALIIK